MAAVRAARLLALVLALAAGAAVAAQSLTPWRGGATPALELADLDGRPQRLTDFRGRVVVVNFWATWCEPCRDEMPSFERLRASLAGRPFEILAVNLAEPPSRIRGYLEKMPMSFPVLLDPDMATAKAWGARVLPATYVIAPDGRIRYHHRGELDWSKDPARKLVADLLPR